MEQTFAEKRFERSAVAEDGRHSEREPSEDSPAPRETSDNNRATRAKTASSKHKEFKKDKVKTSAPHVTARSKKAKAVKKKTGKAERRRSKSPPQHRKSRRRKSRSSSS